jgi:hypothetical protein
MRLYGTSPSNPLDSRPVNTGRFDAHVELPMASDFFDIGASTVEVAPLVNQIKDLRARTDVLRGYL